MSYEPSPPVEPGVISSPIAARPDRKGLAIASLVLGVLSLFSFCLVFCAGPLGLAGIITGIAGLKSSQRGLAIAGIVLSALGLVISVVLALIGVALMPAWTDFQNWNFDPDQFVP